jgi:hypothetical protein
MGALIAVVGQPKLSKTAHMEVTVPSIHSDRVWGNRMPKPERKRLGHTASGVAVFIEHKSQDARLKTAPCGHIEW